MVSKVKFSYWVWVLRLKGLFPKMKIMSLMTHPHVIPSL